MTYGTATYGGTATGSTALVDNDITDRVPEREAVRRLRNDTREGVRTIRADERELSL